MRRLRRRPPRPKPAGRAPRGRLRGPDLADFFFGKKATPTCPSAEQAARDRHLLDVDKTRAQAEAAAKGHYVIDSTAGQGKKRYFEPTLLCALAEAPADGQEGAASGEISYIVDVAALEADLRPQCARAGLGPAGCDEAAKLGREACAREFLVDTGLERQQQTARAPFRLRPARLAFAESFDTVVTVDGADHILAIAADDDLDDLSSRTCARFGLADADCGTLRGSLASVKPPKWWLD